MPGAIEELDPEERSAFALRASDRTAGLGLITERSAWLDGDGWKTMFDASGNSFRNQGACVSFYAKSGATPIGR